MHIANDPATIHIAHMSTREAVEELAQIIVRRSPLVYAEARMLLGQAGDLRISPLHRHVRHPWYSLALVLIWTRDMDAPLLLTSLLVSGYFALGSRLEERKLEAMYGVVYRDYCRAVPGLLPRPWRCLDAERAAQLERAAGESAEAGKRSPQHAGGQAP